MSYSSIHPKTDTNIKNRLIISISHHQSSSRHSIPIRACLQEVAQAKIYALHYDKVKKTLESAIRLPGIKEITQETFDSADSFLTAITPIKNDYDEIFFFADINLGSEGPVVTKLFQSIVKELNTGVNGSDFLSYVGAYTGDEISPELSHAFEASKLMKTCPRTVFKLTNIQKVTDAIKASEKAVNTLTHLKMNWNKASAEIAAPQKRKKRFYCPTPNITNAVRQACTFFSRRTPAKKIDPNMDAQLTQPKVRERSVTAELSINASARETSYTP